MSSAECFQTVEVTACRRALGKLHELVTRGHGRVQITRRGCDQTCVLISLAELDALERALEILSETGDFQQMCGEINQAATATTTMIFPSQDA